MSKKKMAWPKITKKAFSAPKKISTATKLVIVFFSKIGTTRFK